MPSHIKPLLHSDDVPDMGCYSMDDIYYFAYNRDQDELTLTALYRYFHLDNTAHRLVRQLLASNPASSADVLRGLAASDDRFTRCNVALNTSSPVDVLLSLSADDDYLVRTGVASNVSCPDSILRGLSDDASFSVLCSLANNAACPDDIREKLSRHDSPHVRSAVARSGSCLDSLSSDVDTEVCMAAAANPKLSEAAFRRVYERFGAEALKRAGISRRPAADRTPQKPKKRLLGLFR